MPVQADPVQQIFLMQQCTHDIRYDLRIWHRTGQPEAVWKRRKWISEQCYREKYGSHCEISKKEGIKFYLSDFLFTKVLEYITNDIIEVIGITFITLYSVPEAESLYRRRKFEYFGDFMIANNKRYLDGCIPMYIKIDDE